MVGSRESGRNSNYGYDALGNLLVEKGTGRIYGEIPA